MATIPAIIEEELFDQVQAKMAQNKANARRNNKQHRYLLRAKVSCGECRLAQVGRTSPDGRYAYYSCGGRMPSHQNGREERCRARSVRVRELDEMVWQDIVHVLSHPEILTAALERAQSGTWLPRQLQTRQQSLQRSQRQLADQLERLTQAYLDAVIPLEEYGQRRRKLELEQNQLEQQLTQLNQQARQQQEVAQMATSLEQFCQQVTVGLDTADFDQKRQIVELLIDRVVVNSETIEIRYVLPTAQEAYHTRFCNLRSTYCVAVPVEALGIGGVGYNGVR